MNLEEFFSTYPNYGKFNGVQSFQELFEFLTNPFQVVLMLEACRFNRPAIEGVALDIEGKFKNRTDLDLNNKFTRQAVGILIAYIMNKLGYFQTIQRDITKLKRGQYFTSGTHYEEQFEKATYRLVMEPKIVKIN